MQILLSFYFVGATLALLAFFGSSVWFCYRFKDYVVATSYSEKESQKDKLLKPGALVLLFLFVFVMIILFYNKLISI